MQMQLTKENKVMKKRFDIREWKSINESSETPRRMTEDERNVTLEAVANFNEYTQHIYKTNEIKNMVENIRTLAENASRMAIEETADWFDVVSVKRDTKSIGESVKIFESTAKEIGTLQQRLESVFEDIGGKLSKYYEIKELNEEPKLDPVGKEDGDIDNDGDQDASDEFLAKKRAAITKAINNESVVGTLTEGFATWSMQFAPQVLGGVTLDPKKVYKVKARSTVEAIKKASKAAGIKGDGWMATQTHKLTKIG
jgi:hypothetical protein